MAAKSTLQHWEEILEAAVDLRLPELQGKALSLASPSSRSQTKPEQQQASDQSFVLQHLVDSNDAWHEAADAAEADREALESELRRLRADHATTAAALAHAERRLGVSEESMEAWREASQASEEEIASMVARTEAKGQARTDVLEAKLERAQRDVASLTAQQMLADVHAATIGCELGHLDGSVGFLTRRLALVQDELAESLRAQEALRTELATRRRAASVADLDVQHLQHVTAAQKRTSDELRSHVMGAQAWARDAEGRYDEALGQIRAAAAEELGVQAKRMRVWEHQLQRLLSLHEQQQHGMAMAEPSAAAQSTARFAHEVRQLMEQERALIGEQSRLFALNRQGLDDSREALTAKYVHGLEAQLEESQRAARGLDVQLDKVGRLDLAEELAATTSELRAARERLREQEVAMGRISEWTATEIAKTKTAFDAAVRAVWEHAWRLTPEAAAAVVEATDPMRQQQEDRLQQQQQQQQQQPPRDDAAPAADAADAPAPAEAVYWDGWRLVERRSVAGGVDPSSDATGTRPPPPEALGTPARAAGGCGAGGSGAGGSGADGSGAGGSGEDAYSRLVVRVAELEEKLRLERQQGAAKALQANDHLRRDLEDAQRWVSQLEAQLELTSAALSIEREEAAEHDLELSRLRHVLQATEAEAEAAKAAGSSPPEAAARGNVPRPPRRPSVSPRPSTGSAHQSATKQPAAAAADVATGALGALTVGSPPRPEDVLLRRPPSPTVKAKLGAPSSAHEPEAARRRKKSRSPAANKAASRVV